MDLATKIDFMKQMINIITHPLTIIISFLMIIIVGQQLGGFYLFYIALALPHFGIHAILAILGILILLINHYQLRKQSGYLIHQLINIIGVVLLPISLFVFFNEDNANYNVATLHQTMPLLFIGLFILLTIIFVVINIVKAFKNSSLKYIS